MKNYTLFQFPLVTFFCLLLVLPQLHYDNNGLRSSDETVYLRSKRKNRAISSRIRIYERKIDRMNKRIERTVSMFDRFESTAERTDSEKFERLASRAERRIEKMQRRVNVYERRVERLKRRRGDREENSPSNQPEVEPTVATERPATPPRGENDENDSPPTTPPVSEIPTAEPVPTPVVEEENDENPPRPIETEQDAEPDTPAIIVTIPGIDLPGLPQPETPDEEDPSDQPQPGNGKLLEKIDFETGDFSQWRNPTSGSSQHEVVTSPVCGGKYAGKWTSDGSRTESAANRFSLNQDLWYGWALFIPNDYCSNCKGTVTQPIHGFSGSCDKYKDNNQIMHLRLENDKWGAWFPGPGFQGIGGGKDIYTPVKKGQWTYFVLNAKLTSQNNGYITLWIDGQKVADRRGATWHPNCPTGPYFKMGTYAGVPNGEAIYGDEIRVGTSRADVDPAGFCR